MKLSTNEFQGKSIRSITLRNYSIEGVRLTPDPDLPGAVMGPLYFQLRFSNGLNPTTPVSNLPPQNMIQIPLESMGGWPSNQLSSSEFTFPILRGSRMGDTIDLEVYGSGSYPQKLVFRELCLWLVFDFADPVGPSPVMQLA